MKGPKYHFFLFSFSPFISLYLLFLSPPYHHARRPAHGIGLASVVASCSSSPRGRAFASSRLPVPSPQLLAPPQLSHRPRPRRDDPPPCALTLSLELPPPRRMPCPSSPCPPPSRRLVRLASPSHPCDLHPPRAGAKQFGPTHCHKEPVGA
jgi:hypothetical protein